VLPSFEFRFFCCSYLPGIPLSLVLYRLALLKCWISREPTYFLIYIVLSPLIIGLFIDGIRHGIELKWPRCGWEEVPEEKVARRKRDYGDVFLSHILSRSVTLFHIRQFFSNFGISLLLALFVIFLIHLVYGIRIYTRFLVLAMIVTSGISFLLSYVFKKQQKELILNKYFK